MADYYTQFSFAIPEITEKEKKYIEKQLENAPSEGSDFNWAIDEDGLWIYSEESGSPDDAAGFVQEFLKKFRPKESVGFEFAFSCSKPRLDSYGGGAAFVTAESQEWTNTFSWLSNKQTEWMKKNGTPIE